MGQLEEYIKESLKKGYVQIQIREALLRAGYSRLAIDAAFQQRSSKKYSVFVHKKNSLRLQIIQ